MSASQPERVDPGQALSFDVSGLPPLLQFEDGRPVSDTIAWAGRRAELLDLFKTHIYGQALPAPRYLSADVLEQSDTALDGRATRQQIRLRFSADDETQKLDLLLYLPKGEQRAPVFLGLNFHGNHTVHSDPAIKLADRWVRNSEETGVADHQATDAGRGSMARRWPIEAILEQGFGVATAYYGDLAPDNREQWRQGVYSMFFNASEASRPGDDPGAISAWAWGLSRAMDWLAEQSSIDKTRVSVMGHSRLGKTALWAGVTDQRFDGVISNDSGCGGASLFRHRVGETIEKMHGRIEYWFCPNFSNFRENEAALPIDQHQLIAMVAPRRCYVASAQGDVWADPVGEFMALREAAPAWELFDEEPWPTREMPAVDQRQLTTHLGYHMRSGPHDVLLQDWQGFMELMDT